MDDFQHIGYCLAEKHEKLTPSGSHPLCSEASSLSDWRKLKQQQEFLRNKMKGIESRQSGFLDPAQRAQAELELEYIRKEWRAVSDQLLRPN